MADATFVRRAPDTKRRVRTVLARGSASDFSIDVQTGPGRVRVRQPLPPDLSLSPSEDDGGLAARLVPRRRGRHVLPPVALRRDGPLGLGRWYHRTESDEEVLVYPDLPTARRLVTAVRYGTFRDPGRISRGMLGLGTDFESIRDYSPDDDVRQVNWRATARLARPMSNQYRVEQYRDVMCLIDAGRLMASPLGDRTRLDAALDALTAVALVADEVGDRCGALAFDATVRHHLSPKRAGGNGIVRALFDLEPSTLDSDYELAFRSIGLSKRSFVLVFTDLLDEAAARSLIEGMPVLSKRHFVVVASPRDPDLETSSTREPRDDKDVYEAAVALDVLSARAQAGARLKRARAEVLEAAPELLAASCVSTYLGARRRATL